MKIIDTLAFGGFILLGLYHIRIYFNPVGSDWNLIAGVFSLAIGAFFCPLAGEDGGAE